MVYVDEAGISNLKDEPFVVVAGIIVHVDHQSLAVEKYLATMIEQHIHPDHREGFVFHAKDLFHGSGAFMRDDWPKDVRWEILRELVSVPAKFGMPIVAGAMERPSKDHRITQNAHAAALLRCVLRVQSWMRQNTSAEERAVIVSEANDAGRLIRDTYRFIRNPNNVPAEGLVAKELPLDRIVDTPYLAEKADAPALQIADACAFSLKRKLMMKPAADFFFAEMQPVLTVKPLEIITPADGGPEA